jgi:sec-independent protein translocase protein TatB
MEILGIGPSELIFIFIIALIILGPKDMQKAGKTIGKWLRGIVTSDGWKMFQQTSRELRTLPNRLMREANEEMNKIGNELNDAASFPPLNSNPRQSSSSSWMNDPNLTPGTQPIPFSSKPATPSENKIVPPAEEPTSNESDQQKDA